MVKPTVNSEKHIIQHSLQTVTGQTISNILVLNVNNALGSGTAVRVGAIVKAVFVEIWVMGSSSQPVVQTLTVEKVPSNAPNLTQVQGQDLNEYPNKKNILYTTQGLVGDANSNPIPVVRQWIKIPKSKQRMGSGDSLFINVSAIGEVDQDLEICGLSIFKEYY